MKRRGLIIPLVIGVMGSAWSQTPEYPGAFQFAPAHPSNYSVSNRGVGTITRVVIHIQEGFYNGTIGWFQNPASGVSAHYVTRSSDGQVTQMVLEKDRAFHATVWNSSGVGIEHEGFSNNPGTWYTDTQYRSSARLTRYLCQKYGIPRARTNIQGHKENGQSTSCPGPWDWTLYMNYVGNNASYVDAILPGYIAANSQPEVTMRFTNLGLDNWSDTGSDPCQLGTASASPYFVSGDWISSTRAAGPTAITAPNGVGEFTFKLQTPSVAGTYTQDFQLYRSSIGAFGPVVTLSFTVGQSDIIVDNSDPGFSIAGSWSTATSATDKYGSNYRFVSLQPKSANVATWALNPSVDGVYDIYAWWSQGTNRSTNALYEIEGGRNGGLQKFVNQQTGGGQWNYLGTARLRAGQGNVKLYGYGNSGSVVIADAVRMVGPKTSLFGGMLRPGDATRLEPLPNPGPSRTDQP